MPGVFNPKKFLDLGKVLMNDPDYDEDSKIRTAFGRFYYAAFLTALRRIVREGISVQDKNRIHQEVINAYMDNGFTSIGDMLDQLREMRVKADYEMETDLALSECRQYAALSDRTIQLIVQIHAFP